jgi:hypothetical protein
MRKLAAVFGIGMVLQAPSPAITVVLTGQSMIRSDLRSTKPAAIPIIKGLLSGEVIFTDARPTPVAVTARAAAGTARRTLGQRRNSYSQIECGARALTEASCARALCATESATRRPDAHRAIRSGASCSRLRA